MRIMIFGSIAFFVLLGALAFFVLTHDITGAVVLSESAGFVQQKMLANSQSKTVIVFSIALGIVVLGTLTLGIFYRAKIKKHKELDQYLEKEINYRGLCEQEETIE